MDCRECKIPQLKPYPEFCPYCGAKLPKVRIKYAHTIQGVQPIEFEYYE